MYCPSRPGVNCSAVTICPSRDRPPGAAPQNAEVPPSLMYVGVCPGTPTRATGPQKPKSQGVISRPCTGGWRTPDKWPEPVELAGEPDQAAARRPQEAQAVPAEG